MKDIGEATIRVMVDNELEPCPMCGSASYIYNTNGRRNPYKGSSHPNNDPTAGYAVHCSSTCITTRDYASALEAVEVWNRRV